MKPSLFAAIVSELLLACACGSPDNILPAAPARSGTPCHLTINAGETVSILLDTPAEPGYNWYYTVSEDWVISMFEPYDYPARSSHTIGQPLTYRKEFRVTGLKPGKVTVRFYQMNPALSDGVNNSDQQYTINVQ
jgi:hypothetical protein